MINIQSHKQLSLHKAVVSHTQPSSALAPCLQALLPIAFTTVLVCACCTFVTDFTPTHQQLPATNTCDREGGGDRRSYEPRGEGAGNYRGPSDYDNVETFGLGAAG